MYNYSYYLSLGTNKGDKKENLVQAKKELQKLSSIVLKEASCYETEPVGYDSVHWYWNTVIAIDTNLSPAVLLKELQAIEKQMGRVRVDNTLLDRVIDIDILLAKNLLLDEVEIIQEMHLQIPHPRLHLRNFILYPLSELAPNLLHPILDISIQQLKHLCSDGKSIRKVSSIAS